MDWQLPLLIELGAVATSNSEEQLTRSVHGLSTVLPSQLGPVVIHRVFGGKHGVLIRYLSAVGPQNPTNVRLSSKDLLY